MPYAIYLLLGLGAIKPTSAVLKLVDRSTIRLRGVVEDVLVHTFPSPYRYDTPNDIFILDTEYSIMSIENEMHKNDHLNNTYILHHKFGHINEKTQF